jgi:hypothetical protein
MKAYRSNGSNGKTGLSYRSFVTILTYLAAGGFPTRKSMRAAIATVANRYESLAETNFDGTFFGPISSAIERAVEEAKTLGFLEEYVYYESSKPLHYARSVSLAGRKLVETLLMSDSDSRLPISEEEVTEISANSLFVSTIPTGHAIAMSLYLIGKNLVTLANTRNQPEPFAIGTRISKESWKRLSKIYSERDSWGRLVRVKGPEIEQHTSDNDGTRVRFSYGVNPENAWARYSHYLPTKDQFDASADAASRARSEDKTLQFLLECIEKTGPTELAEWRQRMAERLCSTFPDIPDLYCATVEEKLKTLSSDYDLVRKTYDDNRQLIEKLAISPGACLETTRKE